MGNWGTGLFDDDSTSDLRDYCLALLASGHNDAESIRKTEEQFRAELQQPETGGVLWIAFAVTLSKVGRLDAKTRDQALAALDAGADLSIWERENPKLLSARRRALKKAGEQLTGAQPARTKPRRPRAVPCGLTPGDILGFDLGHRVVLLRVAEVRTHQLGETPVLEELAFDGRQMPPEDKLAAWPTRTQETLNITSARSHRFLAYQGREWVGAGFKKLASVALPADSGEPMGHVDSGWNWVTLADRIRAQRAAR
ncbi:MAG: hypothetical protein IT162_23645 [Bryobacterales bacterium]|nr:hypothetical protein [Bryobacterales bacterium]